MESPITTLLEDEIRLTPSNTVSKRFDVDENGNISSTTNENLSHCSWHCM